MLLCSFLGIGRIILAIVGIYVTTVEQCYCVCARVTFSYIISMIQFDVNFLFTHYLFRIFSSDAFRRLQALGRELSVVAVRTTPDCRLSGRFFRFAFKQEKEQQQRVWA